MSFEPSLALCGGESANQTASSLTPSHPNLSWKSRQSSVARACYLEVRESSGTVTHMLWASVRHGYVSGLKIRSSPESYTLAVCSPVRNFLTKSLAGCCGTITNISAQGCKLFLPANGKNNIDVDHWVQIFIFFFVNYYHLKKHICNLTTTPDVLSSSQVWTVTDCYLRVLVAMVSCVLIILI